MSFLVSLDIWLLTWPEASHSVNYFIVSRSVSNLTSDVSDIGLLSLKMDTREPVCFSKAILSSNLNPFSPRLFCIPALNVTCLSLKLPHPNDSSFCQLNSDESDH